MKRVSIVLLSFMSLTFFACDQASEGGSSEISANRLINVPETADESASESAEISKLPLMDFAEKEFNFGEIESGEVVEHVFAFTNNGETPLIISNAKASCGCTVPQWPKDPIEPGQSGDILVRFDSKGKSGVQNKVVTITANTQPSQLEILIKGNVKSPKPEEQPS